MAPEVPVTECLLMSLWGKVTVQDGVPLRPEVDKELVNGHPQEVTFQGGYYVAQSLTKQWQDPRLVGKKATPLPRTAQEQEAADRESTRGVGPSLSQPTLGRWEERPG